MMHLPFLLHTWYGMDTWILSIGAKAWHHLLLTKSKVLYVYIGKYAFAIVSSETRALCHCHCQNSMQIGARLVGVALRVSSVFYVCLKMYYVDLRLNDRVVN